jgi:hypothetical protein
MSDPNEKTRLIRRSTSGEGGGPPPPSPMPQTYRPHDPEETVYGGSAMGGSQDQTRIIRKDDPRAQAAAVPVASDATVLVRRSSASTPGVASPAEDLPEGPVVGWLVVVEGPGRGKSVTLGYGMNTIGRESGNRVCLPFGDTQVSRTKHATLTYDPRSRKFFIQHGESTNLTYVGESPVLAPLELHAGDLIRLGDATVLKFMPLCGDDFNWD